MALTHKQQVFVEHYLRCWNASEAARLAGYAEAGARTQGSRMLANADIAAAIASRLEELTASADEVLKRLTDHARGSMEDFLAISDDGTGLIDLKQAKQKGHLHLIKKFKSTRRTLPEGESEVTNEIELYDAQSAIVQLGRAHALFSEKLILDWEERARREGHDPEKIKKQLTDQIYAELVGSGGGRGVGGGPAEAGAGTGSGEPAGDADPADSD